MTEETRQAIRDCAAMVEAGRLRAIMRSVSAAAITEEIRDGILKRWPEAFNEKPIEFQWEDHGRRHVLMSQWHVVAMVLRIDNPAGRWLAMAYTTSDVLAMDGILRSDDPDACKRFIQVELSAGRLLIP